MLAVAAAGGGEGRWLRAVCQTAGRGRLGRIWQSPVGNLHASTLVRLRPADPSPATLGLVAGIAVYELISAYATAADIRLKWPNDLMAGPAKLAGILLERSESAVVVGIGINLAEAPSLPDRPTTSLATLAGHAPEPAECVGKLAEIFAEAMAKWRSDGVAAMLDRWQACAHPPGTALRINLPDGASCEGRYEGLSGDGALRLKLASGSIRMIHAGDVFVM